jgi:hypothetical protein
MKTNFTESCISQQNHHNRAKRQKRETFQEELLGTDSRFCTGIEKHLKIGFFYLQLLFQESSKLG